MNAVTAYALARELARSLAGVSIAGVSRFVDGAVLSTDGGPSRHWHIFHHRREAELVPADGMLIPGAAALELASLAGRRIAEVRSLGIERIILIRFEPAGGWEAADSLHLKLDFTPAAKPIAIYTGEATRAAASIGAPGARRPGALEESLPPKPLSLLDLPETPPPEIVGTPPGIEGTPAHTARWKRAKDLSAALSRAIAGLDPPLAAALARKHDGDPEALWPDLLSLGEALREGRWSWRTYELQEGGEAGHSAVYPIELPIDSPAERAKGFVEALSRRGERVIFPSFIEHLRRTARTAAGREIKRLERLSANLAEDLASANRSEEFRNAGNLLVTHRHLLKGGMKEITVRDFSGDRSVTIPLDPARSPDRNIRDYFAKAKKGEKGAVIIRNRKRAAERSLEEKRRLVERIGSIEEPSELLRLAPERRRTAERAPREEERRFRRFPIDERNTLYVGRSDEENDILTHRFAAPGDLWFHAQGVSGSHAVLKSAGSSIPKTVIERAAEIAAWFSKARNSTTVPVICAEKRYVRRPRKSKAGTAAVLRSKTLFVSPRAPEDEKP